MVRNIFFKNLLVAGGGSSGIDPKVAYGRPLFLYPINEVNNKMMLYSYRSNSSYIIKFARI